LIFISNIAIDRRLIYLFYLTDSLNVQ